MRWQCSAWRLPPHVAASHPRTRRTTSRQSLAGRAAKDNNFRSGSDSPVPKNRRDELLPLAYFPVEPDYKTGATLTPTDDMTVIQVATSTGTVRKMRRVGTLEFILKGQPLKLTAFVEVGAPNVDHLFVPFNDLTSGTESYPGGRYLDLDRNSTGHLRGRLQPRVLSLLLLQSHLRVSVSARGKSAQGADQSRRTLQDTVMNTRPRRFRLPSRSESAR